MSRRARPTSTPSHRRSSTRHRTDELHAAAKPQELDEATGLPAFLIAAIHAQYTEVDTVRVLEGWDATARRPVTLRANTLRASRDEVASELNDAGLAWQPVSWYPDAFVLGADVRERSVWDLDIYRDGKVYLQSLSSMLPPLALAPRAGADVLDMCAAPGGKTSQMAALAAGTAGTRAARITACELSTPRAEKLEHNLAKLGATNVQVMRTDARRLDEWFSFDQVLLDAPCTGSGTVRTHDEHAARHLTAELADRVERSQRALIDRGLSVLKPGGELVYSTCSILARENEDIVAWALKKHRDCELVALDLPTGAEPGEIIEGARSGDGVPASTGSGDGVPASTGSGDGVPASTGSAGMGLDTVPPTLPCRLPEALTVCPSDLFEGFFLVKLRKHS